MRTLRQTHVQTPAMKAAIDRSVMQPTTNYTYIIKSTNMYYKICFITFFDYQHIPIALAIIIGIALQEKKEYNKLPHGISRTTQCYNNCLKH